MKKVLFLIKSSVVFLLPLSLLAQGVVKPIDKDYIKAQSVYEQAILEKEKELLRKLKEELLKHNKESNELDNNKDNIIVNKEDSTAHLTNMSKKEDGKKKNKIVTSLKVVTNKKESFPLNSERLDEPVNDKDNNKAHSQIKTNIKNQTNKNNKVINKKIACKDDEVKKLKKQLALSDKIIKKLKLKIEQLTNRLLISETEVERLSSILESGYYKKTANSASAKTKRKFLQQSPFNIKKVDRVVIVTAKKANLRVGPSEKDSPLMAVSKGTKLLVETVRGDWYRVVTPVGSRAWVSKSVVRMFSPSYGSVDLFNSDKEAYELIAKTLSNNNN